MSRYLALDWDAQQARYVVAHRGGTHLVIDAVGSVARPTESEGEAGAAWSAALAAALAEHKVARANTFVCVDRSQVELMNLTLPPAADAELPELVRNESQRESSAIGDDTAIDFVTLSDASDQPRQVAAVALPKHKLDQILAVSAAAGFTPDAIVLRPYAAAETFLANPTERALTCLLINVFAEDIDLSVVSAGKVVYWRTVRYANVSHDPVAARKLTAEIARTLVVAGNQLEDHPIAGIYLFGTLEEHPALWEQLRDSMSQPCALVDPFASHEAPAAGLPEHAGRYSALVGLAVSAAHGARPAIDLLHPRKRPAPPDRRRMLVLAGAAAGLVLLLGGYSVWASFAGIDSENEKLAAQLDQLDADFKRAGKQQKLIQAIHDWRADDVNWLDELRDLSLRFPSGRDAVVLRMGMSHGRGDGATIDMVGVVRDPAIVSRFENNLRDKYHQISSRHVQERVQDKGYTWHFESSLVIAPRDKKQYVSHLPQPAEPEAALPTTPAPAKVPLLRAAVEGERP
jgi:Tfp pilus assembly PilM family ATPase/outer membrane murein-binding lipoprotein Lpp